MTKREIVFMCCRLLALYLILDGLSDLGRILESIHLGGRLSATQTPYQSSVWTFNFSSTTISTHQLIYWAFFQLFPMILSLALAVFLWFGARFISIRMFDDAPEELESERTLTIGTELRAVAFACLGLFFLAQDVPDLLIYTSFQLWPYLVWTRAKPSFFGPYFEWDWVLRIPLSLWLLFGVRGLAGLWRMAQEKGLAPKG